ncbi:class IV aminotransferase [Brevundimonas sp. Leaf363]|uniref:aminotransferase class IV n=1 Tax=Brevundimonas sp. Leaf363 TaxID=1736353 RepID=UPI0006F7064A|nr:aminotransferase class IV [Brevundimonas sp. Leaf363]KQS55721.1 class IV aminotransferase [Brevundimonas sp. Leaf363]
MTLFIDGAPATPEQLAHAALVNYGAYTSFRVEDGKVRGLDLHIARLQASAAELFGVAVEEDRLRGWMRQALGERTDAWLRVSLSSPHISARDPSWTGAPSVMIAVSDPPSSLADRPWRLQPQTHQHFRPHLKHAATMDLLLARRTARAAGFDDALFLTDAGLISEGTTWNIGFWCGDAVIWPEAPMLVGVTQALLGQAVPARTLPIRLADLPDIEGAFLCNSSTPAAPIVAIGDHVFAPRADLIDRLNIAWKATPGFAP